MSTIRRLRSAGASSRRRGRPSERGQMVPLLAIFAVVLLGSTALATDLSVSTHYKRNLQNITDAAALAGAKQLPAKATSSSEALAAEKAIGVIHNSFPWNTGGDPNWLVHLVTLNAGCGGGGLQCSITVCAGLSDPACTQTWQTVSYSPPFKFTVNIPPKTARVTSFNSAGDPHYYQRAEVIMQQQAGGFFSGIFGVSADLDGAQSVAYHFSSGQAFPFALFSNTIVGDGNSKEIINGNIYAARFLAPQADGHAAICAANDPNGNPSYIVLGALQQGDSGYAGDGQYMDPKNVQAAAAEITQADGACSGISAGEVGMSGTPSSCAGYFGGVVGNGNITEDALGDTCEANPALPVPQVAALPNIPNYAGPPAQIQCGSGLAASTVLYPTRGAYYCSGTTSLTIDSNIMTMTPGIYEILPAGGTKGCDVTMDGSFTSLTGVTFYLENGASMCISPPSGVTINQTPYCGSSSCPTSAAPGDGIYDVLSDDTQNPTITMNTGGGGSTSGVWQVQGTIWLPTGTVNIGNKDALVDNGQIFVNTWNDTSGNHPNPSVQYNPSNTPPQQELLQLVE